MLAEPVVLAESFESFSLIDRLYPFVLKDVRSVSKNVLGAFTREKSEELSSVVCMFDLHFIVIIFDILHAW